MPYPLKPEVVRLRLERLEKGKQIAFGVLVLERALPLLTQFQKETGWTGEGGQVRAALAQVWAALESADGSYPEFTTEDACAAVMPDSEDFGSYVSAAIDTVDIACNLLVFLRSDDLDSLAASVICRQDTVWMCIPETEGTTSGAAELATRMASHPAMLEEVGFLLDDLSALEDAPQARSQLVTWVLERIDTKQYRRLRL